MRARVVLVVLAAATLPVGLVGLWIRAQTLEHARAENAARMDASTEAADHRATEQARRQRGAVTRLCEDELIIDRLLLDLEAERFGPSAQAALVERVPRIMRSMGLAALTVLDGRPGPRLGIVLAAGHFPGRAGGDERALASAALAADDRWFTRELSVWRNDESVQVQGLLTACTVTHGEAQIIVVGGQVLDEAMVTSLAADLRPVRLFLLGADEPAPALGATPPRTVRVFRTLEGEPAARLIAVIDDSRLVARMERLDRTLWWALGASFLLALLLGGSLAVGMAKPLTELETAADRVGHGDMNTMITVRSGGEVGKALHAFNHMVKNLNDAQRRLIRAERIAAWREIARRIAHEIKNPLTPIKMSIETMRKTHARNHPDFDEIFEESTVTILEEVDRLQRIVTEFSRFARMPRPRPEEMTVEDTCKHVVGLHSGGTVAVELTVEDPLPAVRADREQLTQVLVNLVQNACDAASARHGERGGRVTVELSPHEDGVRLRIEDNGPGIPFNERSRIFEPYYTTKVEGTGLGLGIVHRIVSDHGGSIEVDDASDGGAAFVLLLSRAGPPEEASATQTGESDSLFGADRG